MEPEHKTRVTYTRTISEIVIRVEIDDIHLTDLENVDIGLRKLFPARSTEIDLARGFLAESDTPDRLVWSKSPQEKIKIQPKCHGCQANAPGQRHHMGYGGCLYIPSDSED